MTYLSCGWKAMVLAWSQHWGWQTQQSNAVKSNSPFMRRAIFTTCRRRTVANVAIRTSPFLLFSFSVTVLVDFGFLLLRALNLL